MLQMLVMKNHNYHRSCYHPTTISQYIAIVFLLTSGWIGISSAEDGGGLDMSALANLASTIGNNPQIMNMVSGLFNQNSAKLSINNGFDSVGPSAAGIQSSGLDQDLNNQLGGGSSAADGTAAASGMGLVQRSPIQQQVAKQEAGPAQPKQTGGSSLSSLMSLLPSVLPALSGGGLKATPAAAIAASQPAAIAAQMSIASPQSVAIPATAAAASPLAQAPITAAGAAAVAGGNPAQAVINQVLTAYASGQIPPEMIQLGLSGRVPPQIMELALSGTVPPQIIQMVITGQIPMSTINAFLSTQQPAASRSSVAADTLTGASSTDLSSNNINRASGGGGIISTTRALVEALFKPSVNGSRKIIVPTLLGPLPIQIPSLPSVSQFGKMVGSSISNMASMVPF